MQQDKQVDALICCGSDGVGVFWGNVPSGKRSHSWLEYSPFSFRKYESSLQRVHFPASYVSAPESVKGEEMELANRIGE